MSFFSTDVAIMYKQWRFVRAILHRGWWLVTSLYLVVEANLSPFELVFLGTAQGLTVLAFEIPTGVVADTFSRKWSIVIAHGIMGLGMLATGLVISFPLLVATQMLWGLSWTFSTGADVGWVTDELGQPERTAQVLTSAARWEQIGGAIGLVGLGGLAWLTDLATAIIVAGAGMWMLGVYVAIRFKETRFAPQRTRPLQASLQIFKEGLTLVKCDRALLIVLAATFFVNGADEAFSRLFPKRIVELGLPDIAEPIVYLTLLGLITLILGATSLRILEAHIKGEGSVRRFYVIGSAIGAIGLAVFAMAPSYLLAMAGVLLVHGIAWSIVRTVSVIWANSRSSDPIRATVQSFLSLAENAGEIALGFGLGVLAETMGIGPAMWGACLLVLCALCVVSRRRAL